MHQSAHDWISLQVKQLPHRKSILEIGSRDVNGSIRSLFQHADRYLGIDIRPGEGVDVVADAAIFQSDERFDTCVCMEVLEHTDKQREICRTAYRHLLKGGILLVTAAGIGREPHSAIDGGTLKDGEYYQNVTVADLRWWMSDFQLVMASTETPGDVYAIGIKW